MPHRIAAVLALAATTLGTCAVLAAPATPAGKAAPAPAPRAAAPPATAEGKSENRGEAPLPGAQISQDAVARARMHECAHQWSSIKKAGNAGVTTWKEFSATCLVVSR